MPGLHFEDSRLSVGRAPSFRRWPSHMQPWTTPWTRNGTRAAPGRRTSPFLGALEAELELRQRVGPHRWLRSPADGREGKSRARGLLQSQAAPGPTVLRPAGREGHAEPNGPLKTSQALRRGAGRTFSAGQSPPGSPASPRSSQKYVLSATLTAAAVPMTR